MSKVKKEFIWKVRKTLVKYVVFFYLLISFIHFDVNIMNWGWPSRASLIVLAILITSYAAGTQGWMEE